MNENDNRYFLSKDDGRIIELTSQDALVIYDREDVPNYDASDIKSMVMAAADDPRAMICDLVEMLTYEDDTPPTILDVAAAHLVDVDATIEKWAKRGEEMYARRTAGDNSFQGLLYLFLMELEGK